MKKGFFIGVVLLALVPMARAFKVSPVKLELSISRGQTREVVLALNGTKGTSVENLVIYATDLLISKTGVYTFQSNENSKFSAASWIKFGETKLSLNENQKKELKIRISVPMDANPGEYYSMIMIEPEKDTRMRATEKPMTMDYKVRIGVNLILDVPGRLYEKSGKAFPTEMIPITPGLIRQIQEESFSGKLDKKHEALYSMPGLEKIVDKTLILGSFQNIGNTHLYVSGSAIIRSKDGRTSFGEIKLLALGSEKEPIYTFPGDERYFVGVWDKPLPKGEYRCDASYDFGNRVKKAVSSSAFSIVQDAETDETKREFLVVEKKLDIQVPVGALRTKVVRISNSDYRAIHVSFVSEWWVQIEPQSLVLEPGQSKNIKLTITNDGKSKKESLIIVKPDRGMPSEIRIFMTEHPQKGGLNENLN